MVCPSESEPIFKIPRPVKSQQEGIKDFSGFLAYKGCSEKDRKKFGKRKHELTVEDEDNFVG